MDRIWTTNCASIISNDISNIVSISRLWELTVDENILNRDILNYRWRGSISCNSSPWTTVATIYSCTWTYFVEMEEGTIYTTTNSISIDGTWRYGCDVRTCNSTPVTITKELSALHNHTANTALKRTFPCNTFTVKTEKDSVNKTATTRKREMMHRPDLSSSRKKKLSRKNRISGRKSFYIF